MYLSNQELIQIEGGINASLITAVIRVFTTIIDFGKGIGSSIRRAQTKNYCYPN